MSHRHTYKNIVQAINYCKSECEESRPGCVGFFFQRHHNGHEICGFYQDIAGGTWVKHGHQVGSTVCVKQFSYELVISGDCSDVKLVNNADECKDAIKDVFGVENADVEEWNDSDYAKGCFKNNRGNFGTDEANNAPTRWIFNLDGGPGTTGHCTEEPAWAACICRT